ncbi:AlpA family transcriptional regulator [Roseovarius sp. 10]|uniref:AlpA family transcriptional regulator n=1 Tax=Roseovarius sp. 10 TaxID=3080563 RepID=UPI002955BCB8|nr:AlpA family transcriptional regulator [Roseovarius sp. 10]MDV7201481.1 AlpA family transcriptional regulator [Roseovarius sp. 10]
MPQVIEQTGISRAQIYALIGCDQFPRPIRIGKRAVGWIEADIQAWINARPLAGSWSKPSMCLYHPDDQHITNPEH